MAEQVLEFLKEQRHIFGSCPHCQDIFRLNDVRVSYKTAYKQDWMDKIERQLFKGQEDLQRFEQDKQEMKEKAIARAKAKSLPKLLNAAVPMFVKRKLNLQDVIVLQGK